MFRISGVSTFYVFGSVGANQTERNIIVFGAGQAGLAAAWKLAEAGANVQVIEKQDFVGGMCATIEKNGYLFDYGGHRFITKRQDIIDEIQKLMGPEFRPGIRITQYLLWGKRLNYPLELGDLVRKVNPFVSAMCLADYIWTSLKGRFVNLPEDNFEDWVVKRFGRRLYDIFFGQYTAKIWGIPPRNISKEWAAQRISILNLGNAIKQLFIKPKEDPRTYTRVYYYCDHGIGRIAERMAEEVTSRAGVVHLGAEASKVKLTDLVQMMEPQAPADVIQSARKLRYRAIAFVFMTLDQEKVSDNDALYVPEPKYVFFRIEQYKFWSALMVPSPDKTSLCLEVSCFKGDDVWNAPDEHIYKQCVEGLKEARLIADEGVITDYFIHRLDYVYPVFEIGYEDHAKRIREYVDSIPNLVSYGRQGYYQYIHMHHVIAKGFQAADHILNGSPREEIQKVGREEEYFG